MKHKFKIMNQKQYTVLFIDDSEQERHKFQRYANKYIEKRGNVKVSTISPPQTIDHIINQVIAEKTNAVVSDFNLRDTSPSTGYFGDEVINAILKIKPYFPVFILTNFEEEALEQVGSTHYVYNKKILNDKKYDFLNLVEIEITKYHKRIEDWKNEFTVLNAQRIENKLNSKGIERLIELDNFLEKTINQKPLVAMEVKEKQKEKLAKLTNDMNAILKKLNSSLRDNNTPT